MYLFYICGIFNDVRTFIYLHIKINILIIELRDTNILVAILLVN